ncbi:Ig-like domain-containing protein [Streptomyces mayteni]
MALTLNPAGVPPAAADNDAIGYPEFGGSAEPVPELSEGFAVTGTLQAQYEADLAAGDGTSFWMDRMLARRGADPAGDWLFTRGRAVFMKEHDPSRLGFGGSVAYWESIDNRAAYTITLNAGGQDVRLAEDVGQRVQTPSYWRSEFTGGGLRVVQTKFITEANVVVTNLQVTNTGSAARQVGVRAVSPYATTAEGAELTGTVPARNNLTTLYPRLSGDGLSPGGGALTGTLNLPAGGSATTKVQLGFVTDEIADSRTGYEAVGDASPAAAFAEHVRHYNRWWVENLPYIDIPDDNIEKTLYYRWWLLRYNYLDADIPGSDYQFPTSMEGVLGYNNAIVLTIGMFVDDLKYLRDPAYSYGPWVSAGEVSRNDRYTDNPGDPENWSNSYTQYLSESAWDSYQVHGGPEGVVRNLAQYAAADVRGQLDAYDTDGNGLIEYDWGAMTGNDADAVSFDWRAGNLDRAESAYVYSNALAAADAYAQLGEDAAEDEMRAVAERVRDGVLEYLWNDEERLIQHRHVASGDLVPWKEINNYYPYSVGLMPTPDEDPRYLEALRLWEDADEYPVFPFFTANQADKREAAQQGHPGSNNFSVINSTVTFRFLASVLRNYPSEYIDEDWYARLLSWNAWAHYIDGDNNWPDQNEFWADGSADPQDIGYRSWIHHTILGTTNWTVIEDAMGFQPRSDDLIELWPIDIDWPSFAVTDINYRGTDLAVVWDEPGDGDRPYGTAVPEGYSVFLDGERAFTVDSLTHLVYDPETGEVTFPEGGGEVIAATTATLAAPGEVVFDADDRVTDVFAKAGRDVTVSEEAPNLAEGATVSASHQASGRPASAAVDGFTINEPFWGAAGSGDPEDWLALDFGEPVDVDTVRLHFASDKRAGGYAEPAMYTVQYRDGGQWRDVASAVRAPRVPRANLNEVRFDEVTTTGLRVLMTHRPGHSGGLKEIQAFATGAGGADVPNEPPGIRAWQDPGYAMAGAARLVGVVKDDARPSRSLTTRWDVVSAPTDGVAIFEDQTAATTVARFSVAGAYRLRLTADDGERRSTSDVVVTADGAAAGRVNVAPAATPSASYTSGWESLAAVNDGREPTSSGDSPRWGTWPQKGTQWVEYRWPEPVRVDGSDMYFFRDAQPGAADGVGVPRSWVIEWWDGSAWRQVSEPTGYGTAENAYNATGFEPVTTTRLRAVLTGHPNLALGVQEWKVYAQAPEEIRPVHVPTSPGVVPELPERVTLVYPDGTTAGAAVQWQALTEEQVSQGGTSVRVAGLTESPPLTVSATVWVRVTGAVEITSVAEERLRTLAGVAPELPETVTATYNDGSRDSAVPVDWDAIPPDRYARPGTFTVAGAVAGTGIEATATVTVLAGT